MTISRAFEILSAPFTIVDVYSEAEATILQYATENQRKLYKKLPSEHQRQYLKAIYFNCLRPPV